MLREFWNGLRQCEMFTRKEIHVRNELYMVRWRIFRSPWFGIYLHHILRSDGDRELHDHPFSFISLILWGGYLEERPDCPLKYRGFLSLAFRRAEDLHRVSLYPLAPFDPARCGLERPAWTLVFRGPIKRKWGFQTADGWVNSHDFFEKYPDLH